MKLFRDGLTLVFAAAILSSAPSAAEEVGAVRRETGVQAMREAPPLRLAEGLSAEPMARLAPAAVAARDALAEMREWNRNPQNPTKVGFARELATPLRFDVDPARLGSSVGQRVGGGFLARGQGDRYVWGTSVEVEGAKALRLELSDVNLPASTRLWVYGTAGEATLFDLRRLRSDRSIVSPVIESDRIHLEIELPDGPLAAGQGFVVRRVHELSLLRASVTPMADGCLHNGECYDSGDFPGIDMARDGVMQLLFDSGPSTFACSAGLLNDTVPGTFEPWILTAHHCISTQDEALSIDGVFFFRFTDCAGSDSGFSKSVLGADLVATSEASDVTLLRAVDGDEVPNGAVYLGWTSVRPANGTILHRLSHPVRDSDDLIQPQVYSSHQLDETPEFVCDGIDVPHFLHTVNTNGTGISGGSSGSPIFRADGTVVGQLLGGCGDPSDGCGTDENILDGAFSASYPLLQPYLAPTGQICIDDADTSCLLNNRIKVEVTWHTNSGNGAAQVMSFNGERAETQESAFFWFFNPTNFEMGVKVVDACVPPFNHFWVFVSGLTSQGYDVTVTKMSDPSHPKVYHNDIDNVPTTEADTVAFTCP